MELGEPIRTWTVEPVESPAPAERDPAPVEPERVEQPEKVPA